MVDATDTTFETDILERSDQVPVVVDLWAPWCGPCRTLGPIIEKVIEETGGEVELVKVNTDDNPGLSKAFDVQGIPAVHAVYKRKVVASFIGAQPEAKVREFVDGLRPSEAQRARDALMEIGDEPSFLQVLEDEPGYPPAVIGLAELYVIQDRPDDALAMLARVPEDADTRRVAAMARVGAPVVDEDDGALAGVDVEAKLDELLTRVKGDDAARQEFLDLLELMGSTDPRTVQYRRALSRQLF